MGKILLKKKPILNFNNIKEEENKQDVIIPDNIKPIIEKSQNLKNENAKNNFVINQIQGIGFDDLKKINFDNIVKQNKNKKNIRLILN